MDNIVGRLQSCFSQDQIDLIIGSLLGDARLECRSIGVRHPITARLRIHQSDAQKEYVFWKYALLKEFVSKPPRRVMVWHDPKRNKDHYSWYFHTKSSEELGILHPWLYHGKVKVFPKNIEHVITPRMLAIWFMDDGANTKQSFTLNTHCFLKEEQERILEFLKERFDIVSTIVKDRAKWKIAIGRKEYEKFTRIIEPFIIPSMAYKIANPRNDLSQKGMELSRRAVGVANTSVQFSRRIGKV